MNFLITYIIILVVIFGFVAFFALKKRHTKITQKKEYSKNFKECWINEKELFYITQDVDEETAHKKAEADFNRIFES